ncbi:2-dehydro-3-deoxygalactonokinase [Escherichia coli]|nr:2-dehydro-3-deoxygalactonokinase [Escherichia coli]
MRTLHDTFYVSAATGWHKNLHARTGLRMLGSAQGGNQQRYLPARHSRGSGEAVTLLSTSQQTMLHIIPGVIKEGEMPEVMRARAHIFGAISMERPCKTRSIGMPVLIGLPGTHANVAVVGKPPYHFEPL